VKQQKKRTRTLPVTPEVQKVLNQCKQEFIKKFGREPGPSDPIFFDSDRDTSTFLSSKKIKDEWNEACETALSVGIDPGFSFIVGLAFYLIFSLDSPFTGNLSAGPEPFLWLLESFGRTDGRGL
jgi:hypothetical protein